MGVPDITTLRDAGGQSDTVHQLGAVVDVGAARGEGQHWVGAALDHVEILLGVEAVDVIAIIN